MTEPEKALVEIRRVLKQDAEAKKEVV